MQSQERCNVLVCAGAVGVAASTAGLQAVAAAAAAAMRAKAGISTKSLGLSMLHPSSGVGSEAGNEGAGLHGWQAGDGELLDSSMSWGFVRDIQQVRSQFRSSTKLWARTPTLVLLTGLLGLFVGDLGTGTLHRVLQSSVLLQHVSSSRALHLLHL